MRVGIKTDRLKCLYGVDLTAYLELGINITHFQAINE